MKGFTGLTCEEAIDPCARNPCTNNGLCISQLGLNKTRKSFCVCPLGFTGRTCRSLMDTCSIKNPCLNGGTCSNIGVNDYNCSCTLGYIGINCETSDSCISSPCQNGGSCLSLFPYGFNWLV